MKKILISLLILVANGAIAQDKTLGKQPLKALNPYRKAILIGNNLYKTQPKLHNCERDVDSMNAVLTKLKFQTTCYKNSNRAQMIEALIAFYQTLQPTDTAVVYFSMHGIGKANESWLLPIDVNLCEITKGQLYGQLRLSDIINQVLARNTRNAIFLLDACRNMPDLGKCGKNLQLNIGVVAPLYNPLGYFVGFATGESDTANDNTYDKNNSLFTSELLKHLPKTNLGIRGIYDLVRAGVLQRSQNKQDPKRSDELFSDLFLNGQAALATLNNQPREVEMPCADWEMGQTDVVLRAVGEGKSPQQGIARNIARNNAQANIARNLRSTLDLVAERYFMQNDDNDKTEWKELNTEVSSITTTMEMANMAVKCQKCLTNPNNTYTCWVGLEVLAKDVVAKFDEKLPKGLSKKLKYDAVGFEKTYRDELTRIQSYFSKP